MEFTKLLKYGSASLFLVLLTHGLVLGFSIPTTIISIVLLLICFAMEQKLVLHEREQFNTKIQDILTENKKVFLNATNGYAAALVKISEENKLQLEELQKKLDATYSQINTLKTAQGMSSIRRNA